MSRRIRKLTTKGNSEVNPKEEEKTIGKESGSIMEKITNPEIVGPGIWFTIHLMAYHATDPLKKQQFMEYMRMVVDNLKCEKCRMHAKRYLEEHPMEPYLNLKNMAGQDIGLFKWTWIFHNAVNSRLGKPILDWDTAYAMYSSPDFLVCKGSCGEDVYKASQSTGTSWGPVQHINTDSTMGVSYFSGNRDQVGGRGTSMNGFRLVAKNV